MKAPERKFSVQFIVGEKRLGSVLADLNGAEGLSSSLLVEHDPARNLPKGALTEALRSLLKAGPMKKAVASAKLREMGFAGSAFHTTVMRLIRQGEIKLSKDMLTLVTK